MAGGGADAGPDRAHRLPQHGRGSAVRGLAAGERHRPDRPAHRARRPGAGREHRPVRGTGPHPAQPADRPGGPDGRQGVLRRRRTAAGHGLAVRQCRRECECERRYRRSGLPVRFPFLLRLRLCFRDRVSVRPARLVR
ncbi:hypothetical protein B6E66_18050 [Streptomyces maremycinicus]|nr:hypothetical protein B6E66_18050 [Streptomyces sp. B9173]